MKKIFFIIAIAVVAFASCEKEEDYTFNDNLVPGFGSQQTLFTSLDNEVTVNFTFNNPDVNQLTINHVITTAGDDTLKMNKGKIETVSISNKKGSVTFSRSDLAFGENTNTGTAKLTATATNVEGKPSSNFKVNLEHPLQNLTLGETVYHDDASHYMKVTYKRSTGIDLTVQRMVDKVNDDDADDEYGDPMGVSLNTEPNDDNLIIDSIEVVGNDYSINDTVYYKFTASSGNYDVENVISFPVEKPFYGTTGTFTLDTTEEQAYNLVANKLVVDSTGIDSADVAINYGGGTTIGFESDHNAMFSSATEEIYENNNVDEVESEYDANAASSSVTNVSKGDVYIYKTTREIDGETEEYYGLLKVAEAVVSSSENYYHIKFSYKNN